MGKYVTSALYIYTILLIAIISITVFLILNKP